MSLVRKNPWRRFASTAGADMLRWVAVGNVGVIANDPHAPRERNGRTLYTLWAASPVRLAEAAKAIEVPLPRVVDNDPYPHFLLGGTGLDRALAKCGYVNTDRRPSALRR